MPIPISLQLYTVRDPMARDFEGTLAEVAKMGYSYVEFAGFYERTPEQVRDRCAKLGLKVSGAHFGIDVLRDRLDEALHAAEVIGFHHIILPWIGDEYRGAAGYRKAVEVLNAAAREARPHGVTVCYHNHSFEFESLPDAAGKRGMDILYADPQASEFAAELDVYWVQHGRDNPVAWMKKLAGKVPLLHIKDMDHTPQRGFAEVGTGIVDLAAVVRAAPAAGVKFFIIEQDSNWKGTPLESVKTSLENFRKIARAAN